MRVVSDSFRISQVAKQYVKEVRHPYWQERHDSELISFTTYVALGKQPRVDVKEKSIEVKFSPIPSTSWDYFKELFVKFVPALRFGWLVPKYKTPSKIIHYIETATYYNVYPLPFEEVRAFHVQLQSYIPTPYDWLTATPPTLEEVDRLSNKFRKDIYDRFRDGMTTFSLYGLTTHPLPTNPLDEKYASYLEDFLTYVARVEDGND